jgi:hypothetical protein
VWLSSGGHPLPLVVRGDGRVHPVGDHGMVLGFSSEPPLEDREVALDVGDKLVFFTDGVIEARLADGMLGVDGLERLLTGSGDLDAVATGELIEDAVVEGADPRDDVAVLVLRATGAALRARGREGLVRAGSLGRERALSLRLPGGAHAPAAARAAIERRMTPGTAAPGRIRRGIVATRR